MKTKIPPPIVGLIAMLLTFLSRDYLDIFYLHPHLERTFICFIPSNWNFSYFLGYKRI